jgi:SAM-dependent methyltransferase
LARRPPFRGTATTPGHPTLSILDLATGSGDVVVRLAALARKAGVGLDLHACDISGVALAEAERRAKAQGLSTPQLDARIDAARSAAETFKQQLETGLGRSLGPLDEAFGKAGEAIGEIVNKKLVENTEKMVEAVQKAIDASAAQNVNKGQAMLRRSQQVGLS